MAEALVGGAALGAVFGELLKAVLGTKNKTKMFKPTLVYLQSTLESIAPVVTEMERLNNDLGHPKKELETLIRQMEEGTKLVCKCSKIQRFDYSARAHYQDQLVALVDSLEKFFNINIQAQTARNVLEALFKIDRIHSLKNLPVNREDTKPSSSDSAKQVMEPITGTEQEAGQSKAKEGNNQGMKHLVSEKSYDQLGTTEKRSSGNHIPTIGELNRQVKKSTSIEQINKLDTGDDKTSLNKQVCSREIVFLDSSYSFNHEDLLRGSSEVLGKGSYGTTYKAILEDGSTTVALKMLRKVKVSKTEFEKQVEILQTLFPHHPNVCPLRAYDYSEKVLIYDYIARGSFSALMHERSGTGWTQLDLKSRMKISLGAAKGIAHIHSVSGMNFVHGNIKLSNVLVTADFKGCISDFGLTRLLGLSDRPLRNKGYQAPEDIGTRMPTQKSDVYSFGVLLLEMLTGKSTLEEPNLSSWVQLQVMDGLLFALFDDVFKDGTKVGDIGLNTMTLARDCTSTDPNNRPSMDEVVRKIDTVTFNFEYAMKTVSVEEANEQIDQVTRSSSSDSGTVAVDVSESGSTVTQQAKDAAGTTSEEQVMEPFTGTKQEAGQSKFKEGKGSYDAGDDRKIYYKQFRRNKLLGKGSYGKTYKAISLDGSETVVMRKLTSVRLGKTEFEKQAEILKTLFSHHPNVCPLRGYYCSSKRKVLMFDYIAGRSFSALMHESSENGWTELDLKSRMKISLGAAKGLAYIHSVSGMDFVHGNIKSSNVIVTADFKGCISDFGVTQLLGLSAIPSVNNGYQAPEVIETRKLTQKSDVYSFGILLLEMLTGKSPVMGTSDVPSWADLEDAFDDVFAYDWVAMVGDIGSNLSRLIRDCTSTEPNMRPSMDDVVQRIGMITFNYYTKLAKK